MVFVCKHQENVDTVVLDIFRSVIAYATLVQQWTHLWSMAMPEVSLQASETWSRHSVCKLSRFWPHIRNPTTWGQC